MQLDLIRRVQTEFAAMEAMLDIGECVDREDGEAFESAFAELVQARPESLEEASAMLRVLAFVGARYGDDRAMAMQLCTGMLHVAAGLALLATIGDRRRPWELGPKIAAEAHSLHLSLQFQKNLRS